MTHAADLRKDQNAIEARYMSECEQTRKLPRPDYLKLIKDRELIIRAQHMTADSCELLYNLLMEANARNITEY